LNLSNLLSGGLQDKGICFKIEDFELKEEDTRQIAGYTKGLKREYPEAQISRFVIYCFGNQGFRVFSV
jgi:hypothetical protein